MGKPCLVAVLSVLMVAGGPLWADEVDDYVRAQMQKMGIPGLSLAVVQDGKIVKTAGYGIANVETGTPATPETVYPIASLSKQFLATAILLLVQEGKVALDGRVGQYLSGTPESWKNITVRNLLTHTSGIVRDPVDYHPYQEQGPGEVISAVSSMPLSFQPGDRWLYSNVGYYVLAEIIGRVSGEPWDQFVSERLLPAGMAATRTTSTTAIIPHLASGYEYGAGGMVNAERWIAVRPSSAFLSTVLDMAKWDVFMGKHSPLSSGSREMMRNRVVLNDGATEDYGFGWYVSSFLGHERVHHDGQVPGFRSDYERFDDLGLTVIVLVNCGRSSVESFAVKIAGFYVAAVASPSFTSEVRVSPERVAIGKSMAVRIVSKDEGNAAPDSVVEMEIWDEARHAVNKQNRTVSFGSGESKSIDFSWTPDRAGRYTISVGVYGPHWVPSFSWSQEIATVSVQ